MKRGGFTGCGRYDNGVFHCAIGFQFGHDFGHCRSLLSNGDIDALYVAVFLVDDGIDANRRFARLPVADDQFALPPPDWHG